MPYCSIKCCRGTLPMMATGRVGLVLDLDGVPQGDAAVGHVTAGQHHAGVVVQLHLQVHLHPLHGPRGQAGRAGPVPLQGVDKRALAHFSEADHTDTDAGLDFLDPAVVGQQGQEGVGADTLAGVVDSVLGVQVDLGLVDPGAVLDGGLEGDGGEILPDVVHPGLGGRGIVSEGSRRRELVTLILVSMVCMSRSRRYWSFVPQISSIIFRTCLRTRGCQDDG